MDLQAYLRDQNLFTEEPYGQENLLPKERLRVAPGKVVFENFYRSKKEKIYCHLCGGHRHLKGVTGVFDDGSRILFGSSCAGDFFGLEVYKLCSADFRRRTERVRDRFLISEMANSLEPVAQWIKQYEHLGLHIERAWGDLFIQHQEALEGLTAHLMRYNGRLLEIDTVAVGGTAKRQELFEQQRIITHISHHQAIPYLRQVSQRLALVKSFIIAFNGIGDQPPNQVFDNIARLQKKCVEAATVVDSVTAFTADFFRPDKLQSVCDWIETRRRLRLSSHTSVNPQDLKPKFIAIMGSALERPLLGLQDALNETAIVAKLNQRAIKSKKLLEGFA